MDTENYNFFEYKSGNGKLRITQKKKDLSEILMSFEIEDGCGIEEWYIMGEREELKKLRDVLDKAIRGESIEE